MTNEIYLIADRIRSLHNVGSLFRTADAFGVSKLYLCGYTGTPPRKEITKVALGAEETVPWEKRGQTWKLVEELQARGVTVVALEIDPRVAREFISRSSRQSGGQAAHLPAGKAGKVPRYISLPEWRPKFPLALVVGNEVSGVSAGVLSRADAIVHIPMLGKKESLNVSVAAGIALYVVRYT